MKLTPLSAPFPLPISELSPPFLLHIPPFFSLHLPHPTCPASFLLSLHSPTALSYVLLLLFSFFFLSHEYAEFICALSGGCVPSGEMVMWDLTRSGKQRWTLLGTSSDSQSHNRIVFNMSSVHLQDGRELLISTSMDREVGPRPSTLNCLQKLVHWTVLSWVSFDILTVLDTQAEIRERELNMCTVRINHPGTVTTDCEMQRLQVPKNLLILSRLHPVWSGVYGGLKLTNSKNEFRNK